MSSSLADLVVAVLQEMSSLDNPEQYSIEDLAYDVLMNGASNIGVQIAPDVPDTTVDATNDFKRPAAVYLSGGSVSKVEVDGTDTGATSGMFIVPVGKTITLTYTDAPTWVWVTF